MRIYFIRHGHPDYKNDCLTELGRVQAEACAQRLRGEGIQKFFASSKGRAVETAEYTAKEVGAEVEKLDFIQEIIWCSKTKEPIFANGHPWLISDDMVLKGENLWNMNWAESDRFSSSVIEKHVKRVTDGLDEWLKLFGYEREGNYYRVVSDNTDQAVAVFSHAGASSVALSHMLSLPLPWVFHSMCLDFTSITIVDLSNEKGTLTFPRLNLFNDAKHLEGIKTENFFGN